MRNNEMSDGSESMMDILRFLQSTWKWIVGFVLAGLAAGLGYSFVAPKWYTAEVALLPAAATKGGAGMSLSGAAAALGMSDLPLDLGGSVEVDRMDAIIHSHSVTDNTIAKFGLIARYRA